MAALDSISKTSQATKQTSKQGQIYSDDDQLWTPRDKCRDECEERKREERGL